MAYGPGLVGLVAVLIGWVAISTLSDTRSVSRAAPAAVRRLMLPSARATVGLRLAFARATGRATGCCVRFSVLSWCLPPFSPRSRSPRTSGASVDDPQSYGVNYDFGIGAGGEISADVVDLLRKDPDVDVLAVYSTSQLIVDGESLQVVGFEPILGDVAPAVLRGRLPIRRGRDGRGTTHGRPDFTSVSVMTWLERARKASDAFACRPGSPSSRESEGPTNSASSAS